MSKATRRADHNNEKIAPSNALALPGETKLASTFLVFPSFVFSHQCILLRVRFIHKSVSGIGE